MRLLLAFLFAAACSTGHAQYNVTAQCVSAGIWASGIKEQPKDYWLQPDILLQMSEPALSMHKRFVAIIFADDSTDPERISEFFTRECLAKNGDLSKMFVGVAT